MKDSPRFARYDEDTACSKPCSKSASSTISKPEVIKVVQEEAEKIELDPKKITSAKAGEKYERIRRIPEELGLKSALPAPALEQVSSKSSRKKRKHMELEPEIKFFGLKCNQPLPENVLFVNNMVIEEPKYGIFTSPENESFDMKLKKLIDEHPDQEKLKSKKVKLKALRYEMN
ncbi:hypothetical protein Tco_0742163 [Tanacetum coccineum]